MQVVWATDKSPGSVLAVRPAAQVPDAGPELPVMRLAEGGRVGRPVREHFACVPTGSSTGDSQSRTTKVFSIISADSQSGGQGVGGAAGGDPPSGSAGFSGGGPRAGGSGPSGGGGGGPGGGGPGGGGPGGGGPGGGGPGGGGIQRLHAYRTLAETMARLAQAEQTDGSPVSYAQRLADRGGPVALVNGMVRFLVSPPRVWCKGACCLASRTSQAACAGCVQPGGWRGAQAAI